MIEHKFILIQQRIPELVCNTETLIIEDFKTMKNNKLKYSSTT